MVSFVSFYSSALEYGICYECSFLFRDHAYKKASNKIEIEENQDGEVSVKSKKRKRKEEMQEAKKRLYSGFVKSATLENGKLKDDKDKEEKKDEDDEEEEVKFVKLSDEELFKAVGGFTGHK